MQRRNRGGRLIRWWGWTASGLLGIGFGCLLALAGETPPPRQDRGEAASLQMTSSNPSNLAPGLIRRRDSAEEETSQAATAPSDPISTGSPANGEELVEQPGVTGAGGVMVGLKGRFRSAVVLERKADGSTATRCISNLPGLSPGEH